MMSSQRDPRALKIRGALLYSDRRSQPNHLKLSDPFWAAQQLRKVVYSIQLARNKVILLIWPEKNKSTRTCGLVWLNLPGISILSHDRSLPERREVSEVGQEKLLFDLQRPGKRERRKKRRRRVMGPGSCPNSDRVFLLPIPQKTSYITQTRVMRKFHSLLQTSSWDWRLLFYYNSGLIFINLAIILLRVLRVGYWYASILPSIEKGRLIQYLGM